MLLSRVDVEVYRIIDKIFNIKEMKIFWEKKDLEEIEIM